MQAMGLIGAGLMGHGIARNLLKKGHALTVLEHAGNQSLEELIAAGAKTAATPALLAQSAEIIIVCVTGSPQVEDVLLSANGVLSAIRKGTVIIDCSTAIHQPSAWLLPWWQQADFLWMRR